VYQRLQTVAAVPARHEASHTAGVSAWASGACGSTNRDDFAVADPDHRLRPQQLQNR
jgi:hypothetical protein